MENKEPLPNLCRSCKKEFATCDAKHIVFSIDRDPSLRGELADMVINCDAHSTKGDIEGKDNGN